MKAVLSLWASVELHARVCVCTARPCDRHSDSQNRLGKSLRRIADSAFCSCRLPQSIQTVFGGLPAVHTMGTKGYSSGVKRPEREANHSIQEVPKLRMSGVTPAFQCLLYMDRDNIIYMLPLFRRNLPAGTTETSFQSNTGNNTPHDYLFQRSPSVDCCSVQRPQSGPPNLHTQHVNTPGVTLLM